MMLKRNKCSNLNELALKQLPIEDHALRVHSDVLFNTSNGHLDLEEHKLEVNKIRFN